MDINQLLIDSLQLLALGMGAVFIILVALIVIITLVARILPEEVPVAAAPAEKKSLNPGHVAAIAAAVQQYRKNR
jgi:sodium pump decarboxylase gamma subunit